MPKKPLPQFIAPMMASVTKEPFNNPDWIFETKLDGYRAIAIIDLLWDNGRDLTGKTVVQRRERLQEIITAVAGIQLGGYLEKRGVELFNLAKEKGFEGIIAKRKGTIYRPGKRSPDWLKIKARPQQEWANQM